MSGDKTTIGLTSGNKEVMEEIIQHFNEQIDAAKFAMALAIEEGLEPQKTTDTETVWNTGSFDPNGELRDLIRALYPEVDQPTLALEYFINQGFQILDEHLEEEKEFNIPDLI